MMFARVLTEVIRERLGPKIDCGAAGSEDSGAGASWAAPSRWTALYRRSDSPQLTTVFTINGLRFQLRRECGAEDGGVSGSAVELCGCGAVWAGFGLDVCTYQGGFALHLAQVCERVTGVDASRGALEVADRNRELNPGLKARGGLDRGGCV